ncbi:uncharacterized protein ACA1_022670 [Acanthamoeba castellanii str. Neff]|uniref:Uncharacterized protein n=1 Tax=Acanthamoeba castellanii (strain ATCC 30010 / Neff) TaxID=1257118 RepID=L8H9N7_ACACF|nr:uncharacterized protein ACA1_022670 [Acanthamoeba castellanii str. Neff]ELR21962.1 hypothetical protein ACA1_022670 [Acanthamoeba castellanii str. Neff]
MLRTVFAVTLCILALQCYSAAALAPHLECEPFWDAITYCSGDSAVGLWERRCDLQPLNRAHYIASGRSGASYEPTSDGQTFGPSTCRTSGATATSTQTCCSGLAKVAGFCQPVKRSSDSEVEVKRQTSSLVTGYERCHHHWSLTGPASYEGNCFIRRLSTHLPANYIIWNDKNLANCSGEPVAVADSLTFGSAVPSRVDANGFVNIDKCQSNMNWCHCCSKKKLSPLFGSFEYAAGPGLDMDAFDGLDSGTTFLDDYIVSKQKVDLDGGCSSVVPSFSKYFREKMGFWTECETLTFGPLLGGVSSGPTPLVATPKIKRKEGLFSAFWIG